jgi:hypothetical protein
VTLNVHQFGGEEKLYHGTSHWFKPGDTVEPRPDRHYGGPDKAYASGDRAVAGNFAHSSVVGPLMNSNLPKKGVQGALFAPVYEVSDHTGSATEPPVHGGKSVVSTKGFKVEKLAGFRRTDNMSAMEVLRTPRKEADNWL